MKSQTDDRRKGGRYAGGGDGTAMKGQTDGRDVGGTGFAGEDSAKTADTARMGETTQVAALEVRALKKSYGLKPVLKRVDLTLAQGRCMALLGANGAGKTTLLRILAGLARPSTGTVSVGGLDIVRDAQEVRRMIGFVAHQPYLYEELTALENLLFFGRMYSVEQAKERALELLRRVGLERRMHERVGTLSRGQVQRIAWTRALLHGPRLLLLDEPDTGLDQEGNALIEELLREHRSQGVSILLTTHRLERALALSDRVSILHSGRIVYQKETSGLAEEELRRQYQEVVG